MNKMKRLLALVICLLLTITSLPVTQLVFAADKVVFDDNTLTSVNDIVWELSHRGIISDTALWLKKLESDKNSYWLARKTVKYLMENKI